MSHTQVETTPELRCQYELYTGGLHHMAHHLYTARTAAETITELTGIETEEILESLGDIARLHRGLAEELLDVISIPLFGYVPYRDRLVPGHELTRVADEEMLHAVRHLANAVGYLKKTPEQAGPVQAERKDLIGIIDWLTKVAYATSERIKTYLDDVNTQEAQE